MNKPGLKTSEFYMAMAVVLLGALASVYADAEWAKAAGMVAAALASAGYGFARSKVKQSEAEVERERIDNEGWVDRQVVEGANEIRQQEATAEENRLDRIGREFVANIEAASARGES